MKGTVNESTLLGRLGGNPQVSISKSGVKIARFSIATTDGDYEKPETNWHNITVFGKTAEYVEKYFHKSDQIIAKGYIQNYKYINKDNIEISGSRFKTLKVDLLSSANKNTNETNNNIPSMTDLEHADEMNY